MTTSEIDRQREKIKKKVKAGFYNLRSITVLIQVGAVLYFWLMLEAKPAVLIYLGEALAAAFFLTAWVTRWYQTWALKGLKICFVLALFWHLAFFYPELPSLSFRGPVTEVINQILWGLFGLGLALFIPLLCAYVVFRPLSRMIVEAQGDLDRVEAKLEMRLREEDLEIFD